MHSYSGALFPQRSFQAFFSRLSDSVGDVVREIERNILVFNHSSSSRRSTTILTARWWQKKKKKIARASFLHVENANETLAFKPARGSMQLRCTVASNGVGRTFEFLRKNHSWSLHFIFATSNIDISQSLSSSDYYYRCKRFQILKRSWTINWQYIYAIYSQY